MIFKQNAAVILFCFWAVLLSYPEYDGSIDDMFKNDIKKTVMKEKSK